MTDVKGPMLCGLWPAEDTRPGLCRAHRYRL